MNYNYALSACVNSFRVVFYGLKKNDFKMLHNYAKYVLVASQELLWLFYC